MMKKLSCKAMGESCDFVAVGENEDEVIEMMMDHARTDHPEFAEKVEKMTEDQKRKMMDDMKSKMEDAQDEEM